MVVVVDDLEQFNDVWMVEDAQNLELCKKIELIFYNIFMDDLNCTRLERFPINRPINTALCPLT